MLLIVQPLLHRWGQQEGDACAHRRQVRNACASFLLQLLGLVGFPFGTPLRWIRSRTVGGVEMAGRGGGACCGQNAVLPQEDLESAKAVAGFSKALEAQGALWEQENASKKASLDQERAEWTAERRKLETALAQRVALEVKAGFDQERDAWAKERAQIAAGAAKNGTDVGAEELGRLQKALAAAKQLHEAQKEEWMAEREELQAQVAQAGAGGGRGGEGRKARGMSFGEKPWLHKEVGIDCLSNHGITNLILILGVLCLLVMCWKESGYSDRSPWTILTPPPVFVLLILFIGVTMCSAKPFLDGETSCCGDNGITYVHVLLIIILICLIMYYEWPTIWNTLFPPPPPPPRPRGG